MSITFITISDEEARKRMITKLEYYRDVCLEAGLCMDPIDHLSDHEKFPIEIGGSPKTTHFNCTGSINHHANLFIEVAVTIDRVGNTRAWMKNARFGIKALSEYTWFTEVIDENNAMMWLLQSSPEVKKVK